MTAPRAGRAALRDARRIVLKIGSKSLSGEGEVMARLADDVARVRAEGKHVVVVSSGAIALGMGKLGQRTRPREIAKLQAAAAAGQSLLMSRWERVFQAVEIPVAQVLLTHADLADRARANNARASLAALLELGAVPIINENDTVAVEEIKFGDNDQLASMVVPLTDADVLVLLSDVEGLLRDGARVPTVEDIEAEARPFAGGSTSGVGTGGMMSKVEAARRATMAGASVLVADARVPGIVGKILEGDDVGTLFVPAKERLPARKHWIGFTLRPRGTMILDGGAASALTRRGTSLLAVGVLGVRGDFHAGDSVELVDVDGRVLGRGLARLGTVETSRIARTKQDGEHGVVVHADDLVVF